MTGSVHLPLDMAELTYPASGNALVRRTILPSGVRILSENVPGSSSATLGYWVAVGSRDELPFRPPTAHTPARESAFGSTHFLEHLLFKGTPNRTALDIAVAFDAVGGEHNAMTSKEYTCYYAKVRDIDLPMAVDVIADMLTSSLIDPAEFETERGVILEELAMSEDDPGDVASNTLFEAVFGEHPLGRPVGGTPETVAQTTRDAVMAHYRATYRPQDLVITAAGSVDHNVLVSRVTAALESAGWDLRIDATPVSRRSSAPAPIARRDVVRTVARPTEQTHLLVGVPALTATDDRRVTMGVLNSIFGSGMSSRLFQEVREKRGLAYSVYSFAPAYSDAGVFGMYGACTPAKASDVAQLMLDELRRLARDGVTDDEMRRANGQLSGASALALEDSDTRMSRLGRAEITLGEFTDLDENLRRLALVTARDVQELAHDLVSRPISLAAVGAIDDDVFAGFGSAIQE
ncbi:pitrilysin family protein [Okibacterium endophyticum]